MELYYLRSLGKIDLPSEKAASLVRRLNRDKEANIQMISLDSKTRSTVEYDLPCLVVGKEVYPGYDKIETYLNDKFIIEPVRQKLSRLPTNFDEVNNLFRQSEWGK